ncbi:hypothetical protein D3C71_1037260 [compost metagenome]
MTEKQNWFAPYRDYYCRHVSFAFEFFATMREFRDVTFRKPVIYRKFDTLALLFNTMLGQALLIHAALWSWSVFSAFNVFNFVANATSHTNSVSRRLDLPVHWASWAGHPVRVPLLEKNPDGVYSGQAAVQKIQWVRENTKAGDWSFIDHSGFLKIVMRDPFHVFISSINLEAEVTFLFKRRKDAMLFKLTFGGA